MRGKSEAPAVALTEADAQAHLEELALRVAATQDAADDARELRDLAIVEYIDAGHSQAKVASWAKVSRKRVHDVLSVPR